MSSFPEDPKFSKVRAALWPIQNSELKKFLPLGGMMFLVLFSYTLLRNIKDALVVTAPSCGAEVIPFIKLWDLPIAFLFFLLYTKLSNSLSRANLFYACLIPYLLFFTAFAFYIYPNREFFHPSEETISILRESCPHLKWFISLYGIWSFAFFYILSDLYGSIVISLLFWQFANEITRTNEAKRFYSFFGFLGNIALIASGTFGEYLANLNGQLSSPSEAWTLSITYMLTASIVSGCGILLLYKWMDRYVLTDPRYYEAAKSMGNKKENNKPKLSLFESLRYLLSSKYLGFIALLVISYGITANIIDVTWKSQLKEYFPEANDYFRFMAGFSFWTGVATMTFIFFSKGIVSRFGWFTGAMVTPSIFLITTILFFSFILFKDVLEEPLLFFGITSLCMAVFIGAAQNILGKGMKYSLFDPTKEMTYIPLNQELKVKGKAAVDVIGSRLGKSGGGFIQLTLLTLTAGTQTMIMPYLSGLILVIMIIWMGAVKGLSKLYSEKVQLQNSN
ncbi:MAG: NTP/NDP exchange transporter [Alphaproteobacteria bacterium]|nr:NTP/NDP exchange transporter [Alphaproteobacteria bacterium]